MEVHLDYGTDGLTVDLPEQSTVIEPDYPPGVPNVPEALRRALAEPLDSPTLEEIVPDGGKVAISVCDGTRPQPRESMLRALFGAMPRVRREDIVILVATGTQEGLHASAR